MYEVGRGDEAEAIELFSTGREFEAADCTSAKFSSTLTDPKSPTSESRCRSSLYSLPFPLLLKSAVHSIIVSDWEALFHVLEGAAVRKDCHLLNIGCLGRTSERICVVADNQTSEQIGQSMMTDGANCLKLTVPAGITSQKLPRFSEWR